MKERIKKLIIQSLKHEERIIICVSAIISISAIVWFFMHNQIIAYGDSESHLNIAKRVVHGITPGMAQLGGIWLPLPHIMMLPFILNDSLWRTGLAGSIVSAFSFIVTSLYLFRLSMLVTRSRPASYFASALLLSNPNMLYMQATPMTELSLIMFFVTSSYYVAKYLKGRNSLQSLIVAAFLGLAATLSRYDGWFMVLGQAGAITIHQAIKNWRKIDSQVLVYATVAFFGIVLWLSWDWIILGDPFYFTNSEYSAKSQQQDWLGRGQLPAYHNLEQSLLYYTLTSAANIGYLIAPLTLIGLIYMALSKKINRHLIILILMTPFVFNIYTLYAGQSVIFIPELTPSWFDWQLFNVRYGLLMVPAAIIGFAFLFSKSNKVFQGFFIALLLVQIAIYMTGKQTVISWEDGVNGLSTAKESNAAEWFRQNYDGGLILMDDFARSISVARSGIPMQKFISEANKPHWPESLIAPEKYATWIIMQRNDKVWNAIYDDPDIQGRLYKYFQKVYTSDEVLVFKKNNNITCPNCQVNSNTPVQY